MCLSKTARCVCKKSKYLISAGTADVSDLVSGAVKAGGSYAAQMCDL